MNAYDEAIALMAKAAWEADDVHETSWRVHLRRALDALLAARYPSDCETCGGTGRVGKFGLSENLKVTPKPCPSCRRLLVALTGSPAHVVGDSEETERQRARADAAEAALAANERRIAAVLDVAEARADQLAEALRWIMEAADVSADDGDYARIFYSTRLTAVYMKARAALAVPQQETPT